MNKTGIITLRPIVLKICTEAVLLLVAPIVLNKGLLSSTIGCLVQFNTVGRRQRQSLFALSNYYQGDVTKNCMDATHTTRRFWNRKWFLYTVGILFGVGLLSTLADNQRGISTNVTAPVSVSAPVVSFASLSRARFDDILKSAPELKAIDCIDSNCRDVVYFDYKTVPSDLEFVIRGNAATFSKFKLDNLGVSNVTIIARLDGQELMTCVAAQGRVKDCQ